MSAFTLIELLVAISLSILLIYGLFVMFNSAAQVTTTADAVLQIQQAARSILQFIDRHISGAFVNHDYHMYMWAQDTTDSAISTHPNFKPHVPPTSTANLSNAEPDSYGVPRIGHLIDSDRRLQKALHWLPDQWAGLFVRAGSQSQIRQIRTNSEFTMEVEPGWQDLSGGTYDVPRNIDRLMFFTSSAVPLQQIFSPPDLQGGLPTPVPRVASHTLVLFTIDDPALRAQPQTRRRPPRLICITGTRRMESGKFKADFDRPLEVGRYVTDFNVEYAERVWRSDHYRLIYRPVIESSESRFPDTHPLYPNVRWANYGERYDKEYPRIADTPLIDTTDPLWGMQFDPGGGQPPVDFFNEESNAVCFRELPPALRITIRVTSPDGRVARTYSQVMRIHEGLIAR